MNAIASSAPSPASVALLLGLSFFLGLAYEDFFSPSKMRRPGGIRTFPLLALAGGLLYLFDPTHLVPLTAGLLVLGGFLAIFYFAHIRDGSDDEDEPNVALVVPILNVHAFLLGPTALALPHWIAVTTTVAAVLLLTGRAQLHDLARRIDMREIVTAGEFLILTGIVLPLLPNHPVTDLTAITPRQAWLALLVVCTFSYVSYLAQRYWAAAAGGLWMAALGGLYSSTATTVVLARQAKTEPAVGRQAQAGITIATGIMYLRILAIIAVFNLALARRLLLPLGALSVAAFVICALQYWIGRSALQGTSPTAPAMTMPASRNPLELVSGATFAVLFVVTSLVSAKASAEFGATGIYTLAAIVGISDIDPFVLNLAQGGTTDISGATTAAAILIAASSNNILKAVYAVIFGGGRRTAVSAAVLVFLALAGLAAAMGTTMLSS